ncbi:universal stress protein A-like protein [Forsythia ovata]|uniref:Universal stress protein A-like protein n=1 Tax=Forsythia ovata TaxID=205694 RepID=A0ABD1UVB6_9LAMI
MDEVATNCIGWDQYCNCPNERCNFALSKTLSQNPDSSRVQTLRREKGRRVLSSESDSVNKMAAEGEPTRIMVAVNESTLKGYPHASISSRGAFDWTLKKIVRSNTSGFKLLFLHVQVPDEDGFDDVDSIFASPEDFASMKHQNKIRGIHLKILPA